VDFEKGRLAQWRKSRALASFALLVAKFDSRRWV
jgi:hypothetical protein